MRLLVFRKRLNNIESSKGEEIVRCTDQVLFNEVGLISYPPQRGRTVRRKVLRCATQRGEAG